MIAQAATASIAASKVARWACATSKRKAAVSNRSFNGGLPLCEGDPKWPATIVNYAAARLARDERAAAKGDRDAHRFLIGGAADIGRMAEAPEVVKDLWAKRKG
jgi:hypothetical protein